MGLLTKSAVAVAALSCLSSLAHADGVVIIDLDGNTQDRALALAGAANGNLYISATSRVLGDSSATARDTSLALDTTGQLVTAFGTNGRINQTGLALATQSSSGLAMARGFSGTIRSATGALVADFLLPAPDFGTGLGGMYSTALTAQTDDRIVFGGGFNRGGPVSDAWMLARYNSDGVLDTSFGAGNGWVRKDAGISRDISALRVLPSSKILAIGNDFVGVAAALGRFNADGTTDFTGFGTNGFVTVPVCRSTCALGVDSLGKIYVWGGSNVLARLNADGSTDATYTGVAAPAMVELKQMAVDSADRVIVIGRKGVSELYVARYLSTGALDATFGTGGEVSTQIGPGSTPRIDVVGGLVQSDDKPVALLTVASDADGGPSLSGATDIAVARLTVAGTPDATFGAGHTNPDLYPDAFAFPDNTAPYGTVSVVSDPVTISGINGRTNIYLASTTTNSGYSIGCTGVFVTGAGTLMPGDTLCLRHSSNAQANGTAKTTVNVGGRVVSYTTTSTNQSADVAPDAFAFTDQTNVARGATVTSNAVTITGLTGIAPVAIQGGEYSIGCAQAFTTGNGSITNGQTVCVRHVASSQFNTAVDTTLAIGGVVDTFTSTTKPEDTTPNAFTFAALSDVQAASIVTSSVITITGIDSAAPITVSGGEYSIACGSIWTSQPGTLPVGQQICVRHTAASQPSTSTTTTLTIGGVAGNFVSTTAAQSAGNTPGTNNTGSTGSSGKGGGGALSLLDITALLMMLGTGLISKLAAQRSGSWPMSMRVSK